MRSGQRAELRLVPSLAVGLALAYLVTAASSTAGLALVCVAAAVAASALALLRRPSRRLRGLLAALAVWLLVSFGGAWLLRGSAASGAGWVLLVVYLLPLPIVPWLYSRTFAPDEARAGRPLGRGSGTAEPGPEGGR